MAKSEGCTAWVQTEVYKSGGGFASYPRAGCKDCNLYWTLPNFREPSKEAVQAKSARYADEIINKFCLRMRQLPKR